MVAKDEKGADSAPKKELFGAIPMRAFSDKRLTRTHLSVLGVVSKFDGFGKNGTGCYASQERIAQLAGCTSTTVSKRVHDLVHWGYLTAARQKNRRRLQYRVVHQTSVDSCSTGQVLDPAQLPGRTGIDPEQLSYRPNKDIPLRGLRDPAGNPDRNPSVPAQGNSAEAGSRTDVRAPDHAKHLWEVNEGEFWAYRARMARALKEGHKADSGMVDDVQRVLEGLYDLELDRGLEMAFESLCFDVEHAAGLYDD